MQLTIRSIYTNSETDDVVHSTLYRLLAEREPQESISHHGMPTFNEHLDFIKRRPYKFWGLLHADEGAGEVIVGSIYLSFTNEIGIAIFKKHRRMGYAREAIKTLIAMFPHERAFLANINPVNAKSIMLFKNTLGFELIQETYKFEPGKEKKDAVS